MDTSLNSQRGSLRRSGSLSFKKSENDSWRAPPRTAALQEDVDREIVEIHENENENSSSPRKRASLADEQAALDQGWRANSNISSRAVTGAASGKTAQGSSRAITGHMRLETGGSDMHSMGRKSRPGSMATAQMSKVLEARQFAHRVQERLDGEYYGVIRNSAALKIQSWYRMCRYSILGPLALGRRKRTLKRINAVVNLQRVFRGHRARHDPDLELRIEIRRLEHCCAILIQVLSLLAFPVHTYRY